MLATGGVVTATANADEASKALGSTAENNDGVHVSLYDYWDNYGKGGKVGPAYEQNKTNVNVATGGSVNDESSAKFQFGDQDPDHTWNHWTGAGGDVTQGIVQNNLNGNDYPTMADDKGGHSLKYLFSGSDYAVPFENVTGLFGDVSGNHYSYDSAKNFAHLNGDNSITLSNGPAVDTTHDNRTMFLPFNTFDEVDTTDGDTSSAANYAFGMKVTANFMQPKDGKVVTGDSSEDMVFNFSGDDDVWVYVDDALVLDIGGIHDARTGSINFASGKVKVQGANGEWHEATLQEMLSAAGVDTSDMVDGRFPDYSGHTLKFFYLERGHGASNCKLDFNLQTVPDGTVMVGKQITGSNTSKFSNASFQMSVALSDDKSGTYTPYVGDYYVCATDQAASDCQKGTKQLTDKDGKFWIKNNQYALLVGNDAHPIKQNTWYKVTEYAAGDYEQGDYKFTLDGVTADGSDLNGKNLGEASDPVRVDQHPMAMVNNSFETSGKYVFAVKKVMAEGQDAPDKAKFTMKVTYGDNKQPYAGKYVYWSDGSQVGEPKETANGNIELTANQEIHILDVDPGTTFNVVEDGPGDRYKAPTYSCDGSTRSADEGCTVTVGKDNPKSLVTVTNSLNETKVKVQATKFVDGHDSNQDFTFTLTPAEDTDTTGIISGTEALTATVKGTNSGIPDGSTSGAVDFAVQDGSDFGFTRAGNYTFNVKETNLGAGWQADSDNPQTVTFDVSSDLVVMVNGQEVSEQSPLKLSFKNHYMVTGEKTIALKGTKYLQGRDFKDDSFTFNVTGTDENGGSAPMPSSVKDGKLTIKPNPTNEYGKDGKDTVSAALDFGSIKFGSENLGHTYTYTITEDSSQTSAGVTNNVNGDSYTVTVKVVSDEDAKIATNVTVRGRSGSSVQFDKDKNTVTGLDFTNKYQPKKVSLPLTGTKTLTSTVEGASRQIVDEEFSFNLYESNEVGGIIDVDKPLQTVKNSGASFSFEPIEYKEPGVHYYVVTEAKGSDETIGYDSSKLLVTVTVSSESGKLTASYTVMNLANNEPADDLSFANTFTPNAGILSGEDSLKTEKVLKDWRDGDKFTFTLKPETSGSPMPADSQNDVATVTATKDNPKPTFNNITYTKPGEWDYTIVETPVESDGNSPDLIYSTAQYKVHVNVEYDAKTHGLRVTSTMTQVMDDQGNAVEKSVRQAQFTNSYKPGTPTPEPTPDSVKADIQGVKVLENGVLQGGDFRFKLEPGDKVTESAINTGMIDFPVEGSGDAHELTAKNDANGKFSFGNITFTRPSQGDGWKFNVVEVNGGTVDGQTGLKYDDATFVVIVRVDEDANGKLKTPEITVTKDGKPVEGNEIKFVNSYPDPVDENVGDRLKVKKTLTGDQTTLPFQFVLKNVNGDGDPVASTGTVSVTTGQQDAVFSLNGSLSFPKPGKYEYTLAEVNGGSTLNGVAYDGNTYRVIYEVKYDATSEKLVVEHFTVLDKDNKEVSVPVVFSNSYQKPLVPPTSLTVNLDPGRKYLEGRALQEGEFQFVLKNERGEAVQTTTNSVDEPGSSWGSFSFKGLTFTVPGTYTYTINEVQGTDSAITYDPTLYTVTITVKDIATGNYEVSVTPSDGADKTVEFHNKYTNPNPGPGPNPGPDTPDPDEPDTPEEPDTPDTPDIPDQPDAPSEPSKPGDNGGDNANQPQPSRPQLSQTGVAIASVAGVLVLLAAAGIALVIGRRKARR